MSGASAVTILDGGMGRQLSRMGAPFRLPEWSALALIEAPQFVSAAHDAFIAAGAQVITTNSYALAPSRIGEARFAADGLRLADLSGRLARAAADRAGERVLVAGSLPPVFESYRPDLFDAARAPAIIDVLVSGLAPHIDLWLIETQSSTVEAGVALAAAARGARLPIWVSYTLRDELGRTRPGREGLGRTRPGGEGPGQEGPGQETPAELRSRESVEQAVACGVRGGAQAILFNCSQPEVMNTAVRAAAAAIAGGGNGDVRIGVYANAFVPEPETVEPYAGITEMRDDLNPTRYLEFASQWVGSGASIVGGCCGVGPEHIAALRAHFR